MSTNRKIADKIVGEICLVPRDGVYGITCHEKVTEKCCCKLQKEITAALDEAFARGQIAGKQSERKEEHKPEDWAVQRAAQIWCEEQHVRKEMHEDLLESVAAALVEVRIQAFIEAGKANEGVES